MKLALTLTPIEGKMQTVSQWISDTQLHIRWWLSRKGERLLLRFVWHLPRKVAMWAFIRVAVTGNNGHPDDRSITDALKAWGV